MRYRIILLGLFINLLTWNLHAETYYVSLSGDDSAAGSIEAPWDSWKKGFLSAQAGDTVLIRGGRYYIYEQLEMVEVRNRSGHRDHPIVVMNYPNEQPVLDLSGMDPSLCCLNGILLSGCRYWHVKGLRVENVIQPDNGTSIAIDLRSCADVILENLAVDHIGGDGIGVASSKGLVTLINCDASNCGARDRENGNGITFSFTQDTRAIGVARGCRAWHNLDDGFDCWEFDGLVIFDSCWAFNNGYGGGDGDGFKLGKSNGGIETRTLRILKHCLAFDNRYTGFDQNGCGGVKKFYHCMAYLNDYSGFTADNNTMDLFYNNISYRNEFNWLHSSSIQEHNSWNENLGIGVEDEDFISLDDTGMDGPRQDDGSLPVLDFLRLSAGSDLKDAGRPLGWGHYGSGPDLGPFESAEGDFQRPDNSISRLTGLIGERYRVYDTSGRLVTEDVLRGVLMNYELGDLPSGIYVIYFQDGNSAPFKYPKQ